MFRGYPQGPRGTWGDIARIQWGGFAPHHTRQCLRRLAEPTVVCCDSKVHALQKRLKGNKPLAEHILGLASGFMPPPEPVENLGSCRKRRRVRLVDIYETLGNYPALRPPRRSSAAMKFAGSVGALT